MKDITVKELAKFLSDQNLVGFRFDEEGGLIFIDAHNQDWGFQEWKTDSPSFKFAACLEEIMANYIVIY